MYKKWWKVLGAILVLYTLIMGLILPAGPGFKAIEPSAQPEQATFDIQVTGYNTHFNTKTDPQQIWLKKERYYICADHLEILDDEHLKATFTIPDNIPDAYVGHVFDLVGNNGRDGTFVLRNALTLSRSDFGSSTDSLSASVVCEPTVNQNHPAYMSFPYRIVLYETIRNLFFHVPMWFVMTILLLFSVIYSIKHLKKFDEQSDVFASQFAFVGVVFGLLGFATGSLWGNYTWGDLGTWLLRDTRILGAMIGLMIYMAYFILRSSIEDQEKRARISAVYNIFSFVMFIVFIYIMPRMTVTLHPGAGGNPAFNIYDVDDTMRLVFYPAVLGWILMGMWLVSQRVRLKLILSKLN